MNLSKLLCATFAAALVGVGALAFSATSSDARDTERFRCNARGSGGIKLQATYEKRVRPGRDRQKFNAEFEVLPGRGYNAGQPVSYTVDGVRVGAAPLKLIDGELVAELELDTNDAGIKKPIPPNFPAIETGVVVQAIINSNAVLGCELDRD